MNYIPSTISISKVANGFIVSLPDLDNSPNDMLQNAMPGIIDAFKGMKSELEEDSLLSELKKQNIEIPEAQNDEVAKSAGIAKHETVFIFLRLKDALEFINEKLDV